MTTLLLVLLAASQKHGDYAAGSLRASGVTRAYRLVVPKSINLAKPAPLVVAFHGMLIDSKDVMPGYTKLSESASKYQFILAYPNALGGSFGIAPDKVAKDLAFFDALVAKVAKEYKIDTRRIHVLGMSNGGYFAHLVGKERSKTVASVASHSGPLGLQTLLGVGAARKFPVMIVHGDKDTIFPVAFARENRDKYKGEGHEVKYVEVAGLGHAWATRSDINDQMCKFFAGRPLPEK